MEQKSRPSAAAEPSAGVLDHPTDSFTSLTFSSLLSDVIYFRRERFRDESALIGPPRFCSDLFIVSDIIDGGAFSSEQLIKRREGDSGGIYVESRSVIINFPSEDGSRSASL